MQIQPDLVVQILQLVLTAAGLGLKLRESNRAATRPNRDDEEEGT